MSEAAKKSDWSVDRLVLPTVFCAAALFCVNWAMGRPRSLAERLVAAIPTNSYYVPDPKLILVDAEAFAGIDNAVPIFPSVKKPRFESCYKNQFIKDFQNHALASEIDFSTIEHIPMVCLDLSQLKDEGFDAPHHFLCFKMNDSTVLLEVNKFIDGDYLNYGSARRVKLLEESQGRMKLMACDADPLCASLNKALQEHNLSHLSPAQRTKELRFPALEF